MATLHDRMPVILERDEYGPWLDPECKPAALQQLLDGFPSEKMEAVPVGSYGSSTRHEGAGVPGAGWVAADASPRGPDCTMPAEVPMSGRKPTSVIPASVALVLLGAYVGAYFVTVHPAPHHRGQAYYRVWGTSHPAYRQEGNGWLSAFWAPATWLDRRIRPHVWEPRP